MWGRPGEPREVKEKRAKVYDPTRRVAICSLLLASLGITELLSAAPEASAAAGFTELGFGKYRLELAQFPTLKRVGAVVTLQLKDGSAIAVLRESASAHGYRVISLTCPHNYATVMRESADQGTGWICTAHGAEFSLPGKVLRGPARAGLYSYPLAVTAKFLTIG